MASIFNIANPLVIGAGLQAKPINPNIPTTLIEQMYKKYKDVPWVHRIMSEDTRSIPSPYNPNERSSILMSSAENEGKQYIFPTIFDINSNLTHIPKFPDNFKYAMQTGNAIEVPNEQIANYLANNGYKQGKYWNNYIKKY